MADPQPATATTLTISDDLRKAFPEIIELIVGSESMNDSERQYWINILPVMTPDQVQSLRDILHNERTQLQAIDQKYSQTAAAPDAQGSSVESMERERAAKAQERRSTEATHRAEEEAATTDLLSKIEGGQS